MHKLGSLRPPAGCVCVWGGGQRGAGKRGLNPLQPGWISPSRDSGVKTGLQQGIGPPQLVMLVNTVKSCFIHQGQNHKFVPEGFRICTMFKSLFLWRQEAAGGIKGREAIKPAPSLQGDFYLPYF